MKHNLLTRLLVIVSLIAGACDKDDGPVYSDADRARCAHIDRQAELGEHLYQLCLCCPWPASDAELPPATSEGLSTFGCRINDTLTVINWSPNALQHETAYARLAYEGGSGNWVPSAYRILIAGRGTYEKIDPRGAGIRLRLFDNGNVKPVSINSTVCEFRIQNFGPSIDGEYLIDTTTAQVNITRWDNRVVSGTIEAWFYDMRDSTRRIHLTEGRFDVTVKP